MRNPWKLLGLGHLGCTNPNEESQVACKGQNPYCRSSLRAEVDLCPFLPVTSKLARTPPSLCQRQELLRIKEEIVKSQGRVYKSAKFTEGFPQTCHKHTDSCFPFAIQFPFNNSHQSLTPAM